MAVSVQRMLRRNRLFSAPTRGIGATVACINAIEITANEREDKVVDQMDPRFDTFP